MNELIKTTEQIVLTKQSAKSEIKTYFQKVLELKQSGKEFPVDLELVYPLVYERKEEAVRALRADFIQDVDYQVLRRNAEQKSGRGGHNRINYHLSVSCMEWFVARKVRTVFDVYRKVFHKVAEQANKTLSPAEQLLANAQLLVEQEKRLNTVEAKVFELEAKTQTRPDYFTIVGFCALKGISVNLNQAKALGKKATQVCFNIGIIPDKVPDPRFGEVGVYPRKVLECLIKPNKKNLQFAC
jgi:hypothetical protein